MKERFEKFLDLFKELGGIPRTAVLIVLFLLILIVLLPFVTGSQVAALDIFKLIFFLLPIVMPIVLVVDIGQLIGMRDNRSIYVRSKSM